MAHPTSQQCCLPGRPAIWKCGICRPMAAGHQSPQCLAATSISSCRRHRSHYLTFAQRRSTRWPYQAASASRRFPTFRLSRSSDTISNTISGSACLPRKAHRSQSSIRCGKPSTRPLTASSFSIRSGISARSSRIWISPNLRRSGPPTPGARKTRSTPSAACRDERRSNPQGPPMTLRADHIAGAFFVGFGLLVIALSGDLPTGTLSLPGSGFMPKIVAVLAIFFGLVLALRGGESKPFAEVTWSDARHAAMVLAITAIAVALYERLGFLTTNILLMFALLVVIERRKALPAATYSVGVVVGTYILFVYLLKTPLQIGPFGI